MASLGLHRVSMHSISHPFICLPYKSLCALKIKTSISCTGKKPSDADLAWELAAEVVKLNTHKAENQEAMRKSKEVLFSEICRTVALEEGEMRKKWKRMGEEERRGLVEEFLGNWGQRFHPLSARSVKEMVEEYVSEEDDHSSLFLGLKRWMGFPEDW
ncbi:hypothetical protein SAY87_029937 [Trapa incisa]|uniref:DUF7026 domain-containing protein n=1 Tax=Trapa incisa TaxID=236973 RepID=A0AAN7KCM4_9MYRT|nr:hypothetical protein SAY87_029937 [Trapa incisa]